MDPFFPTVFLFEHRADGTTLVSCPHVEETFTYTTRSGPAAADAFLLRVLKEHFIRVVDEAASTPETAPPPPAVEVPLPLTPADPTPSPPQEEPVSNLEPEATDEENLGKGKPSRRKRGR